MTLSLSAIGAGLFGIHVLLLVLSRATGDHFCLGLPRAAVLVVLEVAAGILYLAAVLSVARLPGHRLRTAPILACCVGIAIALRAAMFLSSPMYENDFYRYLWDGGMTAHGINPYRIAPDRVTGNSAASPQPVPPAVQRLADSAGDLPAKINHPQLRTLYPPVAQFAFAVAHWLAPWSIQGWRLVLLLFDGAALYLLYRYAAPGIQRISAIVIYGWNPLLIKEVVNSAHMDALLFPLLVACLVFATRKRTVTAAFLLALAVGIKIWPVLLAPLVFRPVLNRPKRLAAAMAAFILPVIAMGAYMLPAFLGPGSGFNAYSKTWEMNDALYMLLFEAVHFVGAAFGWEEASAGHIAARAMVGTVVVGWALWCARTPPADLGDMARRACSIVAVLFLLSPTQFPWYALWMLPFLALTPSFPLLVLSATLPLYYLRFPMKAAGIVQFFDWGIVWIEYTPTLVLLVWQVLRHRQAFSLPGGPLVSSPSNNRTGSVNQGAMRS